MKRERENTESNKNKITWRTIYRRCEEFFFLFFCMIFFFFFSFPIIKNDCPQ